MTRRVLTVNAGSTSLKIETYVLASDVPDVARPPEAERIFAERDPIDAAMLRDVDVVAHRFVAVPADTPPVFELDAALLAQVARAGGDAPLHDARALRVVAAVAAVRPDVRQVGVCDSAFHRTMPAAAVTYAIPRALTERGLRRIGYHGLSHEYAAHRGAALAGIDVAAARIVTIHLGGGSSLCAVRDGSSIDTTMGFTPLDGVPMATRSGAVDPGLLLHLLREGTTVEALDDLLQHRSGLAGISGRSGDVRELLAANDDGARLALDVLAWRLRASLGAMIGVLGGVDLVTFTGGVGEHAATVRSAALAGVGAWGAALDDVRNAGARDDAVISAPGSRAAICVVRARENWMLALSATSRSQRPIR